jgi:transcription initiation factor IIE alpha subunit
MSASTDARSSVIYECPECETRYVNERRCPDCQLFTRRIGPGGSCPHCDEPVAQADLT